ncbi:chromosome segregation SMC family protein [Nocardioides alcanivorans]|uniref:chromosome segregation SMC family protein n=1 Tax=Nocardioides alcanivorans TaxID=2897352 RepID=UPI001F46AEF1|nr:AAA family ATPase [Nocardioides alcanivorans]
MYLKSLTLKGFKSFASSTTLQLEPGITCIVGPNGSGKSNVVDALAWVMGEQGAKSLRGGKMEDVIFAGTAGRPPLGRAEVALTIDNSDGALPIEYAEVTISRTMFRNGGSEYAINGNSCRLLDVQELLSDSGIGREMHVIVGQGQLDSILRATPEDRRGFIEEAAGVLKHRKRKEKALRKLDATEGNLNRLNDLLSEIRRQLKPLGRQAEVARRAATVQADVRDARARLMADDLVRARTNLEQELADETMLQERRRKVEADLTAAREQEAAHEAALRESLPALSRAQDTWFSLSGLRERLRGTQSLASERLRNAQAQAPEEDSGRDPDQLDAEAERVGVQEQQISAEVEQQRVALNAAVTARKAAEDAASEEERRVAGLQRAAADRREGLARLHGQVNALKSRAAASDEEVGRLRAAREEAAARADRAQRDFTALETQVAGLDAGEEGLDAEHEDASNALDDIEERLAQTRDQARAADQERTGLAARKEALEMGLTRKDGAGALLAATDSVSGLLGSVAALLTVKAGYEVAVAGALGQAADAVAVSGGGAAMDALGHLKEGDLGRAGLLVGGAEGDRLRQLAGPVARCRLCRRRHRLPHRPASGPDPAAPQGRRGRRPRCCPRPGRPARRRRRGDPRRRPLRCPLRLRRLQCQSVTHRDPGRARRGDGLVGRGDDEGRAAHLRDLSSRGERLEAQKRVDVALAQLHESDAALAAVAEELGQYGSQARAARGEAERLAAAIVKAQESQESDLAGLAELEARLATAESAPEEDPDTGERERLLDVARESRQGEMDARLALRTAEERARALHGRADGLRRAARQAREARARAAERRERMAREARAATAVTRGVDFVLERLEHSLALATRERSEVEESRAGREEALMQVRAGMRDLSRELDELVNSVHRDELARAQQRMRIEQLEEKALEELGLDPDGLVRDYGPDQLIPLPEGDDATPEPPAGVPFVRAEQEKRLKAAERALAMLGKVNPLALEEFSAMEERHRFLTEQLEDLKTTRRDLLDIVKEVDARVEQVFTEAWEDVREAFDHVFKRLFPGGEGKLVLTDPSDMLTTGIEVEARPAGKKVKRLSLLSGGERSLVAVAFLVSLFKARPSPFYILDEVEAALDDTNLGRLLEIYEELRENSQLLVITHQKRTMEVGDALYGVTMRGDGVTTVISQRLRETEHA